MSRKTNLSTTSEIIKQNLTLHSELSARIAKIHGVVNRTLRKLTYEHPPSLTWAKTPLLFLETFTIYDKWKKIDITNEIRSGRTELQPNKHEIHCVFKTIRGKTHEAVIPFYLFNNDPIAVAQWVRKTCQRHHAIHARSRLETACEELKIAEKRLEQARRKVEILQKHSTE